jgi:predicted RNA binding protein YcfA (HicA-like mRNA interferase family)
MSVRFPVCTASEVVSVLRKHKFKLAGQKGSHQKWRHPDGRMVIVPVHGSKSIPIGTLKSIVEGAKLAPDDFR